MLERIRLRDICALGVILVGLKGAQKIGLLPAPTNTKSQETTMPRSIKPATIGDTISTNLTDTIHFDKTRALVNCEIPKIGTLLQDSAQKAYKATSKIK